MTGEGGYPAGFGEGDILFECPACGKSLGIDGRGAGLIVTCTDCGTRMQVPVPERPEPGTMSSADYTRGAAPGNPPSGAPGAAAERVEVSADQLDERRRYLEKLRVDRALRMERIREEVATIQSALDRMVDLLQDVPPDEGCQHRQT